jgi:phage host-nuclease inhibitor protein Gam
MELPQGMLSIKQQVQRLDKNIEGCKREKKQITNKGKPINITADFSTETVKARRASTLE